MIFTLIGHEAIITNQNNTPIRSYGIKRRKSSLILEVETLKRRKEKLTPKLERAVDEQNRRSGED